MKPIFSNLKKLVLKNCNRKNCKMFQFHESKLSSDNRCRHIDYKNSELCLILKNKFREWNSLFFPKRPCDSCLVKPMCIDSAKGLNPKIISCDLFRNYRDELLNQHKRGKSEVLQPELRFYNDSIIWFLNTHWFK